jgi:glycosyltransferase involved in cell wall biosynthesis
MTQSTKLRWMSYSATYVHQVKAGTEIYAHRLNRYLQGLGHDVVATFHGEAPPSGEIDGVRCVGQPKRLAPRRRLDLWGSSPVGLEAFQALLEAERPHVVHFHGALEVHSPEFFAAAQAGGARTIWSYHSPGHSCLQTALLYEGLTPCDGTIDIQRCTACTLAWSGVPRPVAALLSRVDLHSVARLLPYAITNPLERRQGTARFKSRFAEALERTDVVLHYSNWVRDLLLRNGAIEGRLRNLPLPPPGETPVAPSGDPWSGLPQECKLLFVGRVIDIKGLHVILDALDGPLRHAAVSLVVVGTPGDSQHEQTVHARIAREPRARLMESMSPQATLGVIERADVIAVPSTWLETGPFTVLEGQWMGAYVIGSDRGGIAERLANYAFGRRFVAGDPDDFARAVLQWMKERPRPAREQVEEFRNEYRMRFEGAVYDLLSALFPDGPKRAAGAIAHPPFPLT